MPFGGLEAGDSFYNYLRKSIDKADLKEILSP